MNDFFMPEGNVDTEGSGGAQSFEMPQAAPQTDMGGMPGGETYAPRHPRMSFYEALGSQLMQAMAGQQQGPQGQPQPAPGLTANFNNNWLGQALAAGSANGAHL